MPPKLLKSKGGFTLTELVVATTLMSFVLLGIYTTFHSVVLHWRGGSENEGTYGDARRIFTIIEQDLTGIPNDVTGVDAREYFTGDDSSFECVTVAQPMNLDDRPIHRLMHVSYGVSKGALIREEKPLESPLLVRASPDGEVHRDELEYGREFESVIGEGVMDMRITYLWTPLRDSETDIAPTWVSLTETSEVDYRLPNGISIDLILYDPAKSSDAPGTLFTKTVIFDGRVSPLPNTDQDSESAGGFNDAA
jgi:prepilin-type N-terminal cleavage/methylation domain-containing protein